MPRKPSQKKFLESVESGELEVVKLYIEKDGEFDKQDKKGVTPLMLAVKHHQDEVVQVLLEAGADPNQLDHCERNVFMQAVETGQLSLVETFTESGVEIDLDATDYEGGTALHLAVVQQANEIVRLLLDLGAETNIKDNFGDTPLTIATSKSSTNLIEILQQNGAKLNSTVFFNAVKTGNVEMFQLFDKEEINLDEQDGNYNTLLNLAVAGNHLTVVEFLLGKGVNVNIQNNECYTPLMKAVKNHNLTLIELLAKHGAKLDKKNLQGESAIALAVIESDIQSVKLLLQLGANRDVIDNLNRNLLNLACCNSIKFDENLVKYLVDEGVNLDNRDLHGSYPLLSAIQLGNSDIVKILLDHKAIIDQKNCIAHPLITAVENNKVEIVKYLLEFDADINVKNSGRQTPLMIAAYNRNENLVKLLLEYSPIVNLVDSNGNTALANVFARTYYYFGADDNKKIFDICKLLINSGADPNIGGNQKRNRKTVYLLHAAVSNGKQDTVKLLVEAGIDIDSTDRYGQKVFTQYSYKTEIINYLKEQQEQQNIKQDGVNAIAS